MQSMIKIDWIVFLTMVLLYNLMLILTVIKKPSYFHSQVIRIIINYHIINYIIIYINAIISILALLFLKLASFPLFLYSFSHACMTIMASARASFSVEPLHMNLFGLSVLGLIRLDCTTHSYLPGAIFLHDPSPLPFLVFNNIIPPTMIIV